MKYWVRRFRERYGISAGRVSVDESTAGSATACESPGKKETPIEQIEKEFDENDIFNACKTGMQWRMTTETAFLDERRKRNADMIGERLIVLGSASAAGEKLPLFVVGSCNLPNCCEGDVNNSVTYRMHKLAWITGEVFETWLWTLDNQMKASGRTIAIVLDKYSAYPDIDGLSNVKIFFLPPKASRTNQPLCSGIITDLKRSYRYLLLKQCLACHESGVPFSLDLLQALEWLSSSWNSLKVATIVRGFRAAGFCHSSTHRPQKPAASSIAASSSDSTLDGAEGALWKQAQDTHLVKSGATFQDYVNIDNKLLANPSSFEATVDMILGRSPGHDELEGGNNEGEGAAMHTPEEQPTPSFKEALNSLSAALTYMESIPGTVEHCLAVARAQDTCVDAQLNLQ
ncbi:tigger transposable element-derived protein 4-like [Sycon ciliatum]|uniref:tigger transposable element-derived protein 4-like n=1 Tax=Sycon ciliatum TaxID=27933 RepID=UPI0031F6EB87